MNSIIPFQYQNHEIRVIQDEQGSPWWVAKDICDVLGIVNSRDALTKLDDDEKNSVGISDGINRGNPNVNIINEPGLYSLILRSNKPEAKFFKRWITHDVIPAIRKTGNYALSNKKPVTLIQISRETKAFLSLAKTALSTAKAFGLEGNQAVLSANRAVLKVTGCDCLDILDAKKLICEKQEIHLTASDIGKQRSLSAQQVNKLLEEKGLIESYRDHKNRLRWKATEKGKPHTVLKDTGKKHGDGTPVQQLMYLESILK